jgi:hypothetical protein
VNRGDDREKTTNNSKNGRVVTNNREGMMNDSMEMT